MQRIRRLQAAIVVVGALLLVPAGIAAGAAFSPGSDGLGDPMFPLAGNGGYDVTHYSLTLDYTPAGNELTGNVVITARATQNLSRFDLDLRGFSITELLVNGVAASYTRDGQELIITPAAGLVQGKTFTVAVSYTGTPSVVTDPDQSKEGCFTTDDCAYVVNETQGSPSR
jgi:hypothetical protein